METQASDLKTTARRHRRHSVSVYCVTGCTVTTRSMKLNTACSSTRALTATVQSRWCQPQRADDILPRASRRSTPFGISLKPRGTGGHRGGRRAGGGRRGTAGLAPLINSSFKRIPLCPAVQTVDRIQNTDQIPIAAAKPRFKSAWKRSNNCPPIAPHPQPGHKELRGGRVSLSPYEMKSCPREEMRISSTLSPPSTTQAYC